MAEEILEPPFLSDGERVSLKSPARHHGLLTLLLKVARYSHSSFFREPSFGAYTKDTKHSILKRENTPST
jgi:hypothetical protein